MRTAKRTFTALAIAVLLCAGICFLLLQNAGTSGAASTVATNVVDKMANTASTAKTSAANAALNSSGLKTRLADALSANSATIAANTGLSQSTVDNAISQADIQDWQVADLPSTAAAEANYAVSYQGTDATVTTYSDPSYVTVGALGQSVTLSVPESAQSSLSYLPYLS